jgi:hypothetical protein
MQGVTWVLPFFLLFFFRIWYATLYLVFRSVSMDAWGCTTDENQQRQRQQKRKDVRMLITLVGFADVKSV